MMVRPRLESDLSIAITRSEFAASRPEVGSSQKRIVGSAISSMAMLTRLRWPPEMPRRLASPMIECSTSSSRSWEIT